MGITIPADFFAAVQWIEVLCFQDEKRDVFYLRLQSHATTALGDSGPN